MELSKGVPFDNYSLKDIMASERVEMEPQIQAVCSKMLDALDLFPLCMYNNCGLYGYQKVHLLIIVTDYYAPPYQYFLLFKML